MQDSLGKSFLGLFCFSYFPGLVIHLSTSRDNETRTRSISRVLPSLPLPVITTLRPAAVTVEPPYARHRPQG